MSYRGVVVDLDGTVYRHRTAVDVEPVPGAREAVRRLRERGVELLFFSNNPVESSEGYVDRLGELGIEVTADEVRSAASVTAEYLADTHPDDEIFFVGSTGLRETLEARDLTLTDGYDDPDVVLASYSREFDYETMTEAMWALEGGAPFLGTDPDVTIPVAGGRTVPGTGAILNAIAGVAGREPDRIMGKPSETAARAAVEALGVPPEECLVVGDRPDTDLALGERVGMDTALVLTGVTTREDVDSVDPTPDHVVDSLAGVPDLLD